MRLADDLPEVHLCRAAIDFRKGLDAPPQAVEAELGQRPFSKPYVWVQCWRNSS